jgi:hypothetical protein
VIFSARGIAIAGALLAAVVLAGASAAQQRPQGFDPWQGIERDGQIPKVDKPGDIPNPERWRYIPEGRLKPGNVFSRFLVSSFVAPFLFNDTDVGFGGGIAITDLDFRQQRRREFAGLFLSYTVEGQQAYTAVWRRWLHHRENPTGGVFQEDRSFVWAAAGYEKALTRRFFGFGDHSDEDDESSYSDQTAFGRLGVERAVPQPGDDLVLGVGLRGEWHDLGGGRVGGKPDTRDAFPGAFDDAEHASLGWLELEARFDTRDGQYLPYRGFHVGARIDAALLQTGWDTAAIFTLEGSKILPLPPLFHDGGSADEENPPTDTLALHLQTQASVGDLPFFAVPSLGGGRTLRGFIAGRFRDGALWHASAEYRFWVLPRGIPIPFTESLRIERVGFALFGDVGSVQDPWWKLFQAQVRGSLGAGLRITLERGAPFRVDVGVSREGAEVTAGFGLSF